MLSWTHLKKNLISNCGPPQLSGSIQKVEPLTSSKYHPLLMTFKSSDHFIDHRGSRWTKAFPSLLPASFSGHRRLWSFVCHTAHTVRCLRPPSFSFAMRR